MSRLQITFSVLIAVLTSFQVHAAVCPNDGYDTAVANCVAQSVPTCPPAPTNGWSLAAPRGATDNNGVPTMQCWQSDCLGISEKSLGTYWAQPACGSNLKSSSPNGNSAEQPNKQCGSIIQTQNRVLSEVLPLQRSTFDLIYTTDRTQGYSSNYTILTPATNADTKPGVSGIAVEIFDESAALVATQSFSNIPNQVNTYLFDGLNSSGVETWASLKYQVKVTEDRSTDLIIQTPFDVGSLKVKKLGLGGWAPTVWQFYDANAKTLYKGDGTIRLIEAELLSGGGYKIAEIDGSRVHEFNSIGQITSTKLGITGTVVYAFTYTGEKLTQITEPHSMVTTFTYTSGQLSSIANPYGEVFTVALDGNGFISNLTSPASEVYEMTYTSSGLLLTFEKPNGALSEFTYNSYGLLEKDEHSGGYFANIAEEAPVSGVKKFSYTSRMGRKTSYVGDGRLSTRNITYPSGRTGSVSFSNTSDGYNEQGQNVISYLATNTRLGSTAKWLTAEYRSTPGFSLALTQSNSFSLNTPSDPYSINTMTTTKTRGTSTYQTVYTGSTKQFVTTSAVGNTYKRKIDIYERPVEEQVGALTPFEYTYTGKNLTQIKQGARETDLAYSSTTGVLNSVTNALNQTTSYSYDSAGRLDVVTLPDAREIDYDYDSQGRLISLTPEGRTAHTFDFNASELLDDYNPPALSGVPVTKTSYVYNNDNQLTTITRPSGATVGFTYNATSGLLTGITLAAESYTLNYDGQDRVTSINANESYLYRYYHGPYNYWEDFSLKTPTQLFMGRYTHSYDSSYGDIAYDTVVGATGTNSITYTYNNDRMMTGAGNLTLAYSTPSALLTSTDLGNADDTYGYNSFGEMISYDSVYSGTNLYSLDFVRDDLGRITEKTEYLDGTTNVFNYAYDVSGRLTQVDKNSSVVSTYSYDDNNNRTGGVVYGASTSGTYDGQDRMTDYNVYDYTYNANGDLVSKTNTLTSEVTTYNFDARGSLRSVTLPNADVVSYVIDSYGRRLGRKLNGTFTHRYLYRGELQIIGEVDSSRALTRRYVYASKQNIPDYFIEGGNEYRIFSDHLGSPRLIVRKSDGTIMQKMEHDEFGRVIVDTNPGYTPFGFAGGIYDPSTGLVKFGARHYDPETGRWTSKDPILFDGEDPNLYGYVFNDPINLTDVTGLKHDQGGAGGGVGGGGVGPIRGYTGHGLNRSIGTGPGTRSVSPQSILNTTRNPISTSPNPGGGTIYTGPNSTVVLNTNGQIITAWPTDSGALRCPKE